MNRLILLSLFLLASCQGPTPPTRTARLAAGTLPQEFPIGVFQQPAANFARWKSRGCNLLVTDKSKPDSPAETSASRTVYMKAASDAGLRVIIGPDPAGVAADLSRPGLLALNQNDEPENWNKVIRRPDGSFDWLATTAAYRANYARLKAAAPAVPVFGNFNGGPLGSARETDTNPRNVTLPTYREFAVGADWLAADFYIRPQGRPAAQIANYGKIQDRLKSIAPGKPTYAVIECCDQGLTNGAAPNASEVRAAVWLALIHGAQGYVFFPLKVQGGFAWDNTPPDVAAALPVINAEVQANAGFLLNGIRAKDATAESATWTLADGSTLKATAIFDGAAWTVVLERHIVVSELERLRDRVRRIEEWQRSFPAN